MTGSLFVAALACLLAGAVVDLSFGTRHRVARTAPYLLGLAACGCLLTVGIHATVSPPTTLRIGPLFDIGNQTLRFDPLAGLFCTLLFGIGCPVSACFVSWAWSTDGRSHRRAVATGYLALLGSVAVVLSAADAFVFLFAWEALTVAFYLLASATRTGGRQVRAAWATAGIGKVSGASLLFAFLLLAGRAGSDSLASWHSVGAGAVHDVAWVLLVVGFGAKLGIAPLQGWIPIGYPAAPGPARAAMAGIAANVGVYGLWRFLAILGRPPVWLVVIVLLVGGATAFVGILFSVVQSRLSRVVAYSSVENAGIILSAYGVALTGVVTHSSGLEVVGLLAASLQVVAHAVAKSSLFSALAFAEAAAGTDELDSLRGIGRRMRWSGATFGAGALALAGLPPTVGFVSEWFVLEALMQQFRVQGLALRLGLAGAGALVALTTGLAALTFIRVLALAFLGRPSSAVQEARDPGPFGKAGLGVLGVSCLGLAAASPWEVRFLADGLSPVVPMSGVLQALKSPWVLQPVYHGFSILSPSWMWIAMPVAWIGVLAMAVVMSRGKLLRARRVRAWRSATAGVDGPSSYSAFGYANVLRHVLANVLGTRRTRELRVPRDGAGGYAYLESRTEVVEPVETYLYRPSWRAVLWTSAIARRLQSGSVNAYVAYMLLALVAVLAITAALR